MPVRPQDKQQRPRQMPPDDGLESTGDLSGELAQLGVLGDSGEGDGTGLWGDVEDESGSLSDVDEDDLEDDF